MEEEFEVSVKYKGELLMIKASLVVTGYTHKFCVEVKEQMIVIQPDEKRNYRKVIPSEDLASQKKVDIEFLRSIATKIETFRD